MKPLLILYILLAFIACNKDKDLKYPHKLLQKYSWAYDSSIYHMPTGDIRDYASVSGAQTLVFTDNTFTNTNSQGSTTFNYIFDTPNAIRYRDPLSSSSTELTYTIESINNKNLVISQVENSSTGDLTVTNFYHAK